MVPVTVTGQMLVINGAVLTFSPQLDMGVQVTEVIASRIIRDQTSRLKWFSIISNEQDPAISRAVKTACGTFYNFHGLKIIKPELVEVGVSAWIREGDAVVIYFDVPDAEGRT
jgi:hypothetical protein